MTALPMNGVRCPFGTGTGSGIKQDPTIAPTIKNSWPGCSCSLPNHASLTNPIVWLFDQELVKAVQNGSLREKAKVKPSWMYLSQFTLTVPHMRGIKNELAKYVLWNNFDALLGGSSQSLAKEAFQRMDP